MVDAYRIVTIDCMEDLLPSYVALNYQIKCSVEKMKRISRDYLYVKMARNKTTHARDEVRDDQAALTAYMCRNEYRPGLKYPDPQLVSLPVLQDIIGRALDVIDGKDE